MKIAQYMCLDRDYISIDETGKWLDNEDSGYVMVSEPVEVEFIPLPQEGITKAEIEEIDRKINVVQATAEVKINQLKEEKAKLLALTDMSGITEE